jgi:hypothetical protein
VGRAPGTAGVLLLPRPRAAGRAPAAAERNAGPASARLPRLHRPSCPFPQPPSPQPPPQPPAAAAPPAGPGYLVGATFTGAGAASVTAVASSLPLPGLKASATLPLDSPAAARLGLTYAAEAANVAAGVSGLASGQPAFEAAATVGWQQTVLLGAEVGLEAGGGGGGGGGAGGKPGAALARWGACLAYNSPDAQLTLSVSEAGGSRVRGAACLWRQAAPAATRCSPSRRCRWLTCTADARRRPRARARAHPQVGRLAALHTVGPETFVAVEAARRLDGGSGAGSGAGAGAGPAVDFAVGVQRRLEGGALAKVKVRFAACMITQACQKGGRIACKCHPCSARGCRAAAVDCRCGCAARRAGAHGVDVSA